MLNILLIHFTLFIDNFKIKGYIISNTSSNASRLPYNKIN